MFYNIFFAIFVQTVILLKYFLKDYAKAVGNDKKCETGRIKKYIKLKKKNQTQKRFYKYYFIT